MLDLKKLEAELDSVLEKETTESLNKYLKLERRKVALANLISYLGETMAKHSMNKLNNVHAYDLKYKSAECSIVTLGKEYSIAA